MMREDLEGKKMESERCVDEIRLREATTQV
jgi:hypothetical protein